MTIAVGPAVAAFDLGRISATTIRLVALPRPLLHRLTGGFQTPPHLLADCVAGAACPVTDRGGSATGIIAKLGKNCVKLLLSA